MSSSPKVASGGDGAGTSRIRRVRPGEAWTILGIVNDAARKYQGVIPPDSWHDPYLSAAALNSELAHAVVFTGYEINGELVGVMGVQAVHNVCLIRHAYVLTRYQGRRIGGALIEHICGKSSAQFLVGTWAAASWATAFYERHGFRFVSATAKALLLQTYWNIPVRQANVSVVLANPPLTDSQSVALIRAGLPAAPKGGPAAR
jgi:N-acetylglutamate synthase-like GNAT family acetyltransferase